MYTWKINQSFLFWCTNFDTANIRLDNVIGTRIFNLHNIFTHLNCVFVTVTFERKEHHNAVWGLIPEPRTDQRPRTFYFGDMTDADACEQACRGEHMVCFAPLFICLELKAGVRL